MGSTLVLTCNTISTSGPLTFEWLRDGVKLSPAGQDSTRFFIENRHSYSHLTLLDVRPADAGNYSCRVANEADSDQAWSVFSVKGKTIEEEEGFDPIN